MALLNQAFAIFYHPCDSVNEPLKNKNWSATTVTFLPNQIVNSGAYASGAVDQSFNYSNTDNAYLNPSGVSGSMTAVIWASGLFGVQARRVHIGWSNGLFTPIAENGFFFENYGIGGIQSGIMLVVRSSHSSWSNAPTLWIQRDEPIMLAAHAVWFGTNTVSGFLSVNGSGWLSLGSGILSKPDNSWGKATVVGMQRVNNPEVPRMIDEAALWVEGPLPSDADVLKMYRMGRAGVPLNQFDSFFQPQSGAMTCFMSGIGFQSGNMPAFMLGKNSASGSCPTTFWGHSPVSGSVPLVIKDSLFGISGSVPVTLYGIDSMSGSAPLFIKVPEFISGAMPLFGHGFDFASGSIPLVMIDSSASIFDMPMNLWGRDTASGAMNMVLAGSLSSSGSVPLYTTASVLASGSVRMVVIGEQSSSGALSLYTGGGLFASGSMPMVMRYPSLGIHDMPIYLKGASSGTTADFTIEDLLRTGDHDPQVVGRLDVQSPIPVYIQVWDITNGAASPVAITSSGCYAIGDTGRWGWSTQYLPEWDVSHPLYYYRMAGHGESFEGQFFMNKHYARRAYPSRTEVTIVTH